MTSFCIFVQLQHVTMKLTTVVRCLAEMIELSFCSSIIINQSPKQK